MVLYQDIMLDRYLGLNGRYGLPLDQKGSTVNMQVLHLSVPLQASLLVRLLGSP